MQSSYAGKVPQAQMLFEEAGTTVSDFALDRRLDAVHRRGWRDLPAAPLADALEAELGIPIYDSIATTVWKSLQATGNDTKKMAGWGCLFRTALH
jgi:maleate cis-trans isomerase